MKRLLRIILPTALGAISLLAMALPASATSVSLESGACLGGGFSQYYNAWKSDSGTWLDNAASPCYRELTHRWGENGAIKRLDKAGYSNQWHAVYEPADIWNCGCMSSHGIQFQYGNTWQ